MGKFTSQVQSVGFDAIRNGRSADVAIANYRRDNKLDTNDNPIATPLVAFYRVEYSDRVGTGTHWGNKEYKTAKGALKNRKNTRFLRAVKYTPSAV